AELSLSRGALSSKNRESASHGMLSKFSERRASIPPMLTKTLACLAIVLAVSPLGRAQETPYMKPPQAILDVLNAPEPPQVSVSPTRDLMLMSTQLRYPPIADVAAPMLRLAGSRIDPATNGPHRAQYSVALTLKKLADGVDTRIVLPANAKVSLPRWSAD